MATTNSADTPKPTSPRWYAPTPAKFLFAVLVMQGVLFLSAHYRWFWFNERKGYTVLIAVAATFVSLLLFVGLVLVRRLFKSKSQFSLAILLLIIPVTGLPFAWLAREIDLARRQKEAAKFVSILKYDVDLKEKDQLIAIFGEEFFRDAEIVMVNDRSVGSDEALEQINEFAEVKHIFLNGTKVTDQGLSNVEGFSDLVAIELNETQVTNAGLAHLAGLPRLKWLFLNHTPVGDVGLAHLKGLRELEIVLLDSTQVTDAGLAHLKGNTKMDSLVLAGTQISDAGLEHLKGFSRLQALSLKGTKVTDAGLEHLKGLTKLFSLGLEETDVTDEGVKKLQAALPQCEIRW
jgi:CO dehydrogenase/acetyl-CoA synthase epsilon subunit